MIVLVTGANGFLGRNLVQKLLRDGDDVRALVRTPAKGAQLAAMGATLVMGDIDNLAVMREAVRAAQVVYHFAGRLFMPGVPAEQYYRTHVEGTRAVIAACEENSGLQRLVHCSTTGVLGAAGSRPVAEDAPIAPTNAYEQTKWGAEQLVQEAQKKGLPAAIIRPGLVYGPGDIHLLGFFRSIQRRLFRPIGSSPVWLHPIYVDDLIQATITCATAPGAVGECFHIANPKPVSLRALASLIAAELGVDEPHGVIPLPAARAAAAVGDLLPDRLKALAPLTSSRLDFLTHSRVYDVRKASRMLGFTAGTSLREGIAKTVAWYRETGVLSGGDTNPRVQLNRAGA